MSDINWKKINPLHDELLAKVKSLSGNVWKEVHGELHSQYLEMPFWILLYDDTDVKDVHAEFRKVVSPYMEKIAPVQITVSYTLYTETDEIHVDFLNDNQEILAGSSLGELGSDPVTEKKEDSTFFTSKTSSRTAP